MASNGVSTNSSGTDVTRNGVQHAPEKLWEHPSPKNTPMWKFMQDVNKKYQLNLQSYDDLYRWSIENIGDFWGDVWESTGVVASEPYNRVVDEKAPMFPRPSWFEGAKLNFAENLLFPKTKMPILESTPAVIEATETSRSTVTWAELRNRVRDCQAGLMALGLKENDRVAGYVANHTNALVAMLASTALGAIWTAISPDTGVTAVLERLQQIEPTVMFSDNASFYNGKAHPILTKVKDIAARLPSLEGVVVFETVSSASSDITEIQKVTQKALLYPDLVALCTWQHELRFAQLEPDHPVYILYSSGTTGAPKCIVHGAIGTLIQHKKEHYLHCSIDSSSSLFYFTTCTWMMWHWLVSGLASGATLVLYDGSPFRYVGESGESVAENLAMPKLIDELGITHFGTSAKYLSVLEQNNVQPLESLKLSTLQAIYSTGSPLAPSTFQYVYRYFPSTLNLGSITGGTDIVSLFGAPSPLSPVYVGEIQQAGLGMAIEAWDPSGKDVTATGEEGDLVCARAFPCQPVMFWPKGEKGAAKYKASYFEQFTDDGTCVWAHGDFIRINPATGGLIMLGRSDGVLKPQGVRFGSAEIYNVVLKHYPDDVEDALCVGRRRSQDTDETVVLFLKMAKGKHFSEDLSKNIKSTIRKELSARHVPGIIDECPEIPVTSNGKK